ncbi:MAG: SRPBCC family protein [Chloroflexota bacterium]|nr:SRPBCC family protein [Chloroflexota bacterium]
MSDGHVDIERVIEIAAPPEQVWAVMSDVARWPEWTASVTSVERLDRAPLGVGSRARVRQPRFPVAVWTVSALDPGRFFEWRSPAPGLLSVAGHRVDDAGDRASRATLSITWSGPLAPVVRLLVGSLSRRYVETEAQGLKRRCEAAQVPSPS